MVHAHAHAHAHERTGRTSGRMDARTDTKEALSLVASALRSPEGGIGKADGKPGGKKKRGGFWSRYPAPRLYIEFRSYL